MRFKFKHKKHVLECCHLEHEKDHVYQIPDQFLCFIYVEHLFKALLVAKRVIIQKFRTA